MHIQPVNSTADLRRFVGFPYHHYRHDPLWVPPLRTEQWAQYDPGHNPMLQHCTYQLFLLCDGRAGRDIIGRVSAFTDSLALQHWGQPVGLFGSYECVDDESASRLLLDAARHWLRTRDMRIMRGPWSFASQEWGAVVEGFDLPPTLMAPHNPPYYNGQLEAYGLRKAKDLLVYCADMEEGYEIPLRYLELTDRVAQRYGVAVRQVRMDRLAAEVATILDLSNRSISDNWGYYPVTEAEARALARDLRQIIDPRAALIAEGPAGQAVGFALALPDINLLLRGLNGRLLPFGWLKLLRGLPRLRQYRVWALGVVPEYQNCAIDALLYRKLYEGLGSLRPRMEVNYVLEDNVRMNNALRNLGARPLRRYRVYEMPL